MGGTQNLRGERRGQRVGRYRLVRPLEETPLGAEHLATYRTAGGLVAVCRILIVGKEHAEGFAEKLRRIRPLLALAHAGIVRPLDAGTAGGELYVGFEHHVGRDLAALLAARRAHDGTLPPRVAFHVAAEVLASLVYAVRNGRDEVSRSHGSLGLPSVLLTADGHVRLRHFGLAHVLGATARDGDGAGERDAAAVSEVLLQLLTGSRGGASSRGGAAGTLAREARVALAAPLSEAEAEGQSPVEALAEAVEERRAAEGGPLSTAEVAELVEATFGAAIAEEALEVDRLLDADATGEHLPPATPTPVPPPYEPNREWKPEPQMVIGGRYRIVRNVGEGGMGAVVEAEHLELGRRVAIKILQPGLSHDPEFAERFRREARAACRIGHPHIVDVLDFGHTPDGRLYYTMELLEGRSLGQLLEDEGPLDQRRALRMMLQVCDALDAAHEAQVVHRDLKPDNLVVTRQGDDAEFIRVVDFGIAQDDDPASKRVTHTGQIVGTPPYMAPEQIRGTPTDARTDLYAAGAILYEMLTGRPPFEAPSAVEVMGAHLKERPVPPTERAKERPIHPMVEAAVLKALEKAPDDRHQSMADLAFDLWAALEAIAEEGPRGRPPPPPPAPIEATRSRGRDSSIPEIQIDQSAVAEEAVGAPLPAATRTERDLATARTEPDLGAEAASRASTEEAADASGRGRPGLPWWAPTAAVGLVVAAAVGIALSGAFGTRPTTIASTEPAARPAADGGPATPAEVELLRSASEGGPPHSKARRPRRRHAKTPTAPHAEAPAPAPAKALSPQETDRQRRHLEARRLMRDRQYVYAAHAYRVLTSLYPSDAAALAGLGQAELARGNDDAAIDQFRRAVAMRPENVDYRYFLAGALDRRGRRVEALRECDEVLRRAPDHEGAKRLIRRLQ